MISDDDNEFDDNNDDSDDEEEEDFIPTTTPEEVKKKSRPMPACKKVGKPSTSSNVDNFEGRTMLKKKRKSVARKIHIKKEESQKCIFCCLKLENWTLFSSHIKEKHTDKLEERKQLKVKDEFIDYSPVEHCFGIISLEVVQK